MSVINDFDGKLCPVTLAYIWRHMNSVWTCASAIVFYVHLKPRSFQILLVL